MRYGLRRRLLGESNFVELPEHEYTEIVAAKAALMHMLFIEEKIDLVLQNYAAFERELLSQGMDNILSQDHDWSESVAQIHILNLRLINLLTTCRLYIDHTVHHMRAVFGRGSPAEKQFDKARRSEHSSVFGYRVMDAMRNYVQHRGFPIHEVKIDGTRVDPDGSNLIRHTVIPLIDLDEIRRDRRFKSDVLAELDSKGEPCDIRPLVREYVSSIGSLHAVVRSALLSVAAAFESTLKNAEERYRSVGPEDTLGLSAVSINDDGTVVSYIELFDDFIKRRHMLMRKNAHLSHYAWHFVSNSSDTV